MNKNAVIVNPDWIETAKVSLINRKSKKEYLRFLELIGEIIVNNELSDEFIDDTKPYKLFKALRIEDDIFNQYVDELLNKPIDTGLAEKAKSSYTK